MYLIIAEWIATKHTKWQEFVVLNLEKNSQEFLGYSPMQKINSKYPKIGN